MFLILSCGTSPETRRDSAPIKGSSGAQAIEALSKYEETFNPSDFDDEVEIVKESHESRKNRQLLDEPEDVSSLEMTVIQGFRIQIFATANIDEANREKNIALGRFREDSVYVVFDPPVYKVRIGDFPTRFDASRKLPSIISSGYPDSWVVGDMILSRKKTPTNPSQ